MIKWEYTMIESTGYLSDSRYLSDSQMNRLGEEGWELVSVSHSNGNYAQAYFKREKK